VIVLLELAVQILLWMDKLWVKDVRILIFLWTIGQIIIQSIVWDTYKSTILIIKTYFFNKCTVKNRKFKFKNRIGKFIIHFIKVTFQNYAILLMHTVAIVKNTIHIKIFKVDIVYLKMVHYVIKLLEDMIAIRLQDSIALLIME